MSILKAFAFSSFRVYSHHIISFFHPLLLSLNKDRDKQQRQHLNDTVEELKRFNARRKLKGAVQAIASGVSLDPLCCTDIDAGMKARNFNVSEKKLFLL